MAERLSKISYLSAARALYEASDPWLIPIVLLLKGVGSIRRRQNDFENGSKMELVAGETTQ